MIVLVELHFQVKTNKLRQMPRSVAAFAFPLFAPKMYQTLGYGWGNSTLAFVYLAVCVPAPVILWKYGATLRAKGKPER